MSNNENNPKNTLPDLFKNFLHSTTEVLAKPKTDLHTLSGKVVLITGSSRGLGYLLAREFGRKGQAW